MQIKTLHIGGIDLGKERLFTTFKSDKPTVIYELNNWFFDYCYANKKPIVQLPPMDDWTHSEEDGSYWYLAFPDTEWLIWVRSDIVEFK